MHANYSYNFILFINYDRCLNMLYFLTLINLLEILLFLNFSVNVNFCNDLLTGIYVYLYSVRI